VSRVVSEQLDPGGRALDVVAVAADRADVRALLGALAAEGLRVERAHDPESVAHGVVGGRPDVVLVDLRDDDALADRILTWVCRDATTSTLAVTDQSEVDCRLRALQLGATDHLVAPFETREGVARLLTLVARRRQKDRAVFVAGDLSLDIVQRCATRSGETVLLTPREVEVLAVLMEQRECPVSKKQLLAEVWGEDVRSENVVEANVSALRRKLHTLGPPVIHTLHRSGYVFRPTGPAAGAPRAPRAAERDDRVRGRDAMIARP
jgi:DNA-binding response OmpR family regulator